MFRCRAHLDEQRPHLQPRAARGTEGAVLLSARARARAGEARRRATRGGVARAAASKRSIATWCPAPFAARLVTSALRRATSSRSSLSSNCSRPFSRCKAGGTEIARRSFFSSAYHGVCRAFVLSQARDAQPPPAHSSNGAHAFSRRRHGSYAWRTTDRGHAAQACAGMRTMCSSSRVCSDSMTAC